MEKKDEEAKEIKYFETQLLSAELVFGGEKNEAYWVVKIAMPEMPKEKLKVIIE